MLLAFEVPAEEGGLRYENEVLRFPEYYKDLGREPPYVLNRFMYVVVSLYKIGILYNLTLAPNPFEEAEPTLEESLHYDDNGNCSFYDRLGNIGGPGHDTYTKIHVKLLGELHNITGKEINREYAEKWCKC